jgi:hypothetical protein
VITGAAALNAPAEPARATNMVGLGGVVGCSTSSTVWRADNYYHTIFRDNLLSNNASALSWAMTTALNSTDIDSYYAPSSAGADVWAEDHDFTTQCGLDWHPGPQSYVGYTPCIVAAGSVCDQFKLRIDTSYTQSISTYERQVLWCHEMGHSVGLTHPINQSLVTCMNGNNNDIAGHESDLINGVY